MIGRGTWIDKLAHELVEREKGLGRSMDIIRVESGLGASGIPHIGSLGDAARAYAVSLALKDAGYESELIAYSDDLDGLRKIPEGLPDSLSADIAKPVSTIADPYGCHDSYGMHMSSLLLEGLDGLGIKYRFERARDTYQKGLLKEQIHIILSNSQKIGAKIAEMVGQDKYQDYLPYFPVCSKCGRLYTAQAYRYLPDEQKVLYRCQDAAIGGKTVAGCGHEGAADIAGGMGKLAWKVEFAARWQAFDVRFEAYGKDIMDSVKVNDWVADEILGFAHPHHIRYEMFLDKGGKKISKSAGNVITAQKWFRYGTPQSILLLLYKRIAGARELGWSDIPALMAEYAELERSYFGKRGGDPAKEAKARGLYEYVNLHSIPDGPQPYANYRLLVELARVYKRDQKDIINKKLIEYGVIAESSPEIDALIDLAANYAQDFESEGRMVIGLVDNEKAALGELAGILRDQPPNDIQNAIYDIARSHDVAPRDFFQILYKIILGTTRGPKIGPLIADIGPDKIGEMLQGYVR